MKKSELIENSNRYRRLKKGLFGDPSGKIRTFAIISAENPLGWKDSTEKEFKQKFISWSNNSKLYNKQSVEKIESSVLLHKIEDTGNTSLKYGGFTYVPLKGKYGDLEKSYIIFNLTLSDAKTIARDYGQESFFFANVGEDKSTIAYYQTFNGCKTYTFVDISETISDEAEAEDYFSKFGFKFRINMKEFGDDVPEVIDKSAFEESFDEEIRNFSARALKRRQAYRNNSDQLDEGYEDLISYMATGNKKKLSKKRKNQKKALSFFGNAGNPKYNADFFNHVMGSDGGKFGSVNGTDMVAGDLSLNVGGNAGGGESAGGVSSSGGGMGESFSLKERHRTVLESFEIHKELNSLFFNVETGKMKEEVRHRLFKIAYLLIESMIENDIPLSISDILLIGSNAAYNYTEYSDLDLHILVDKSVVEDQELLTNLYNYIKADFNNKYDISIYGHDVEVYLQGLDEENAAAGVYSILKDEWVKFPEQPEEERSITIEDKEIFKNWENRYNNLLDHEIDTFVQDLYKLRKSSLKSEGEFSDGNLVFKEFRNRGYLKDLKDRKNKIKSNELTLEGAMTESSMSRIYKKLTDESSCAIISTYRSERNDAENLKLLQELKQEVKSKYGFIEFISRWSEATDEGVIASDERSLLISNIELSEAMHFAKQYDQASFIYKDEDGCREICSNKFTSWDGVTYTPGDIVRYFNTKRDDKTILNLEDAREIFAKRKGGPASYLVKGGGQKAFHLDEVLEIENARPSYFQKQPTYITILR